MMSMSNQSQKADNLLSVLGTASFFLSPQSVNPQPIFNFLNPQPQVRNYTFKSLVRKSATTFQDSYICNRKSATSKFLKSATASPRLGNIWSPHRKSATFYEPSRRVLQSTMSRDNLLRVD